jgi:aminocarboxymuconate-semialdehyde decarboxylase
MKIIDLDSHSLARTEDYDVEPRYRHLRPAEYVDARGNTRQVFDNRIVRVSTRGESGPAYQGSRKNWRMGNFDAAVRYEHVTAAGIDFQFVSTGIVGEFHYVDPEIGAAFCRAANNFVYETFQKPHPRLFSGVPQVPLQDTRLAIEELRRCVGELGMKTLLMPTNWNGIDLADPYWWNFWDAVREAGATGVIVHFGTLHGPWVGKERLAVLGPEGTTGRRIVSGPFEYWTNICNLIFGGMMDSFPELRFAFLEVGANCMQILKARIEENLGQIAYLREQIAHPLDWYFDRFYFLVEAPLLANDGQGLREAIETFGADHLFLGSDYPHTDGDLDAFRQLQELPGIAAADKEKILQISVERFIGCSLV